MAGRVVKGRERLMIPWQSSSNFSAGRHSLAASSYCVAGLFNYPFKATFHALSPPCRLALVFQQHFSFMLSTVLFPLLFPASFFSCNCFLSLYSPLALYDSFITSTVFPHFFFVFYHYSFHYQLSTIFFYAFYSPFSLCFSFGFFQSLYHYFHRQVSNFLFYAFYSSFFLYF